MRDTWQSLVMMLTLLGTSCGLPSLTKEISSPQKPKTVSYYGYKLFRTDVPLVELPVVDSLGDSDGVDVWSWRKQSFNPKYELDVLTPPEAEHKVRELFSEYNLTYHAVIEDLQSAMNLELSEDDSFIWNRPAHSMTWEKYHSVQDMYQYMDYLQAQYPNFVTIEEIGRSFENRSLLVAKVSTGPDKPAIWIDGGIHAREWVSPATVMYILHRLTEFGWEQPDLVSNFDWYIMPMANPDGYEYSRHHDRLWRKTRSINPKAPECVGVDANRNFGYKWLTGGSSTDPCSNTFAGPEAFSEPETRAIRDFLMGHKDQLKVFITVHAYSQVWLFPWAHTVETPHTYQDMYDAANLAVHEIKANSRTEYSLGQVAKVMYTASGSSADFAYGVVGVPYCYGLELRDLGRFGFILPKEQIEPTGIETYQGIKALARGVYNKLFSPNSTLDVNEVVSVSV